MERHSRRAMLGATAALAGVLAGCSARMVPDDDPSFDRLQRTAVYVHRDVDLSLPPEAPVVEATNNADLLVLPGDTVHGPDQAADWLAEGRAIALLGPDAEARWLDWARSDVFEDTFETRGASDAEPDPALVVAAAIGLRLQTYRHSWGEPPRNRDVLRAIDEDLVDIAMATPA